LNIAMHILGGLTILSGLAVVLAKKPLHSALYLVLTLFFVAGHFALLGAHFVAAIQILVYAGAIMVLVVFVIMLLGVSAETEEPRLRTPEHVVMFLGVCGFIGIICLGLELGTVAPGVEQIVKDLGTTESIGQALLTKFLFPFEVIALLLIAALIGAVLIAYEPKRSLKPGRGLRAKQSEGEM